MKKKYKIEKIKKEGFTKLNSLNDLIKICLHL
jgi:hypothetical protein